MYCPFSTAANIGLRHAACKRGVGVVQTIAGLLAAMLLCLAFAGAGARAAEPAAAPLSPAEARRAIDVLSNPALRTQVIDTLAAIAHTRPPASANGPAEPAAAPAGTHAAAPAAAASTAPAAAATAKTPAAASAPAKVTLNPDSLGGALVIGAPRFIDSLIARAATSARSVRDLPVLWGWLVVMATNPLARSILSQAVWRLAVAIAAGLAVEYAIRRALHGAVAAIAASAPAHHGEAEIVSQPPPEPDEESRPPETREYRSRRRIGAGLLLRRLPLVFGRFVLDLLPLIGFALAAHVVTATSLGGNTQNRLVMLAMADAYAVTGAIVAFARMLLQPDRPRLRLLRMSDVNAAWLMLWTRRLAVLIVFGFAIAQVGLALGMAPEAAMGLLKIDGLLIHIALAIMVVQKRRAVRNRIRAAADETGFVARLRNAFAAVWHWIALIFIVGTWVTWAFEVNNGYGKVLHVTLLVLALLIFTRIANIVVLGIIERLGRVPPEMASAHPDLQQRLQLYQPLVQASARTVVNAAAVVLLLEFCGVPIFGWFGETTIGHHLAAGLATILVTLVISIVIWEVANAALRAELVRLAQTQNGARAARLKTLMPLLRSALLVAIIVVAGLTVLSEIGINIAPLLAGAGIIGVAIGFGSQKLVQDLITGMFLLLENAMQVGDWVTVSSLSGTVEALSVRTIRLRASDGSVHIIPFSSVTSVTNTNRGLGNAAVSVAIAFDADIDRACALLKEIAAGMRGEAQFADKMLSDLQLWGVDKVDGASVTISGQIVCTDAGRWPVQREFNRRMKMRFEDEGVPIFNPVQTYLSPMPGAQQNAAMWPVRLPHALHPAEAGGGK